MQLPEGLRGNALPRFLQGAVVGAIAITAVGFTWGGWVLGSTAQEMAQKRVMSALEPICATRFVANAEAVAELKAEKSSWNRGDIVRKHIKKIGDVNTDDYTFARNCLEMIDKKLTAAAAAPAKS